jgi:hypothetical protein
MVEVNMAAPAARVPSRLKRTVYNRDKTEVVTLQFTGLDAIQRVAGPLWLQRWSKIRRLSEVFIRERLHPGDIFMRGADAFVIAFGQRADAAAREAAAELTRELNERLAQEEPPAVQVASSIQLIRVTNPAAGASPWMRGAPHRDHIVIPAVGEVKWRFHPVWDTRRELVSCYFICPHHAKTDVRVRGYQYEDLDAGQPDFTDLDTETVRVSERALQTLNEQRKRALVGMSLHVSTLAGEAGMDRVLSALDTCDPLLSTYRLIKIAGIETGFPRMQLRSIIGALRARAPKVVVTAAWHEPDVAGLIQCGPTAFGFAYPGHVAGALSHTAAGTLLARFSAGVELAHADGVPLYVEGAIGPHLARQFLKAGADYICSPMIWAPRDQPDAVVRWPSSMLSN